MVMGETLHAVMSFNLGGLTTFPGQSGDFQTTLIIKNLFLILNFNLYSTD